MVRAHVRTTQQLPAAGPAREALRVKGQFWTPDWVAQAMVAYALSGSTDHIFDPAVGAGAFFRAAKSVAGQLDRNITLLGTEIDPAALEAAREHGLTGADLAKVQLRDFVCNPPDRLFDAIVANPPYIRHHRLGEGLKQELKVLSSRLLGSPLDGRAGLHIYFLLRALQLLNKGGRLAFIMPADTCEGVFATPLWRWVTEQYCLEAVITFAPDASPFPAVDTNPLIFLIKNAAPQRHFSWATCTVAGTTDLKGWALSSLGASPVDGLVVCYREVAEALQTGLSRPPQERDRADYTLGDFAQVLRGIATGANDFFFLTQTEASQLGLPADCLKSAIGRTRDIAADALTTDMLAALDAAGRPTLLFSPDGRPVAAFPPAARQYLARGEALGLPEKALISTRRPWYKMEVRSVPPILFAYLGRRNARFIRNLAGAMPLTCFLCVYPRQEDPPFVDKLWQILSHPQTIANLALVGKSYGQGAIKVEPRALERLPLPAAVVREVGLAESASQSHSQSVRQIVSPNPVQQLGFDWI